MKALIMMFVSLSVSSAFACGEPESPRTAAFQGAMVINHSENANPDGSKSCFYKLQFNLSAYSATEVTRSCFLDIDETSTAMFSDVDCSLKDGDLKAGTISRADYGPFVFGK